MSAVRCRVAVRTAVAAAACGLLLAACGTPEGPPPTPTPSTSSSASPTGLRPGSFSALLPGGASVHVTLPATPPPDPEVEKLRRDAGIRRALYARIAIDNSKGTRPVSVSRLTVSSHDGGVYRLEALPRAVPGWAGTEAGGGGRDAAGKPITREQLHDINERVERVVRHYSGDVPVGGHGEEILVGDLACLPDSFASVELTPVTAQSEAEPVRPQPAPAPPHATAPSHEVPSGEPGGGENPGSGEPPPPPEPAPEPAPDRGPSAPATAPLPPDPAGSPSRAPDEHPTPTGTPQAAPTSPAATAPPQAGPTGTAAPETAELPRG